MTDQHTITREEAIDKIFNDDFETIQQDILQSNGSAYLRDLLHSGHKGYDECSNDELTQELNERFDSYHGKPYLVISES